MLNTILLLMLLSTAARCQDGDDGNDDADTDVDSKRRNFCRCVPSFQCDEDGYIKTDGAGLLDPRKETPVADEETVDGKKSCRPSETCCRLRGPSEPGNPPPGNQVYRCGIRGSNTGLDSRIIAEGQDGDTEPGEFPWQGALLENIDGKTVFKCACILINRWFALTAAHCVQSARDRPNRYTLRFGVWDTRKSSDNSPTQDASISNLTVHPDFDDESLINDIAVLGLKSPGVRYTRNVQPVCLPRLNEENTGQKCIVTGWGKNSWQGGSYSNVLRMVVVPILSHSECQRMLRRTRLGEFFELNRCFVCAGGKEGQDACKGDGGGPLVCSRQDGTYGLTGIVSWGISCGLKDQPGVYTKVSFFLNWIARVTKLPIEAFWPPKQD